MAVVGADPDRLRELARAVWDAAQELKEVVTAFSEALVASGFVAVPGDPAASQQFWRALNATWMALEEAAAELRARADALDADQEAARCAEPVETGLGFFGLAFIGHAVQDWVGGDWLSGRNTAYDGMTAMVSADLGFSASALATFTATGSVTAGRVVGGLAWPVTGFATVGEIYCETPIGGPATSPVNQQRATDDDWVFGEGDVENNGAMGVNCPSDCLAQLQG
jgi:hypothetical protein